MIEKLKQVEERYNFINDRLCSPEIAADASLSTPLLKELKTLTPVVEKYREYVKNDAAVREAKEILDSTVEDKDFKDSYGRGLNFAVRLRHRDALNAVHAALEFEARICALARNHEGNLFIAAERGFVCVQNFGTPPFCLCVHRIHSEKNSPLTRQNRLSV